MLDRVACSGCTLTIGEPPPAQGRLPIAARIGSGVLALGALSPYQRPAKPRRSATHAANGSLLSATHRCQVEHLTIAVPRLPLGAAPLRPGANAPRASRSTLSSASSPLQEGEWARPAGARGPSWREALGGKTLTKPKEQLSDVKEGNPKGTTPSLV